MTRWWIVLLMLSLATPLAGAQPLAEGQNEQEETPGPEEAADPQLAPRGPTDVLTGSRPGAPAGPGGRRLSRAVASASVPAGTIQIMVLDARDRAVPGAPIRVGVMRQDGSRESLTGETDERGRLVMEDLPTGSAQAYRINHFHEGANVASTPFRLEPDQGHMVVLRQLPTTRSTDRLLQRLGQTMLEYRNERIHVTQQAQIDNLGQETIVFGDEGMHVDLPRGFTAFQTQESMTDQRLIPDDEGFAIKGSLPPGRITLMWAYDLPLEAGQDVHVRVPIPFTTWRYRVITEAAEGMALEVRGFDEAEVREGPGARFLHTQIERTRESPELREVDITVRGIPGPGPWRFLAVGGALVLLFLGFLLVSRGGDRRGALARARREREAALLDEAAELQTLRERNEIGPKFHAERFEAIVAELASLLQLDAAFEHATAADRAPTSSTKRKRKRKTK